MTGNSGTMKVASVTVITNIGNVLNVTNISRGVFKTQLNKLATTFSENGEQFKAVNYPLKYLHLRCLTGF